RPPCLAVRTGPSSTPTSARGRGARPRGWLEDARAGVARLIGARPREIVFTSGATEANNLALRGGMAAAHGRDGLVVTAIEHASVLETARALAAEGLRVTVVPVDPAGRVDPGQGAAAGREPAAVRSGGRADCGGGRGGAGPPT